MTAVLGVLNKQAIAIAADSAVTLQNSFGRKVSNFANKIFTISKHHPVGVMLYNSASFMGVPWEIIIKLYRKKIGGNSFSKLQDYALDFLDFLKSKNYFSDVETNKKYLSQIIFILFNHIEDVALKKAGAITEDTKVIFTQYLLDELLTIEKTFSNNEKLSEFINYKFEDFKEYSNDLFDSFFNEVINVHFKEITIPDTFRETFEKVVFGIVGVEEKVTTYTGLIFVGYGEEEIYPSIYPIFVSFVVDDKLRYYIDKNNKFTVTEQNNATICSFAQTDVIDTILTGVDPNLEILFNRNLRETIIKYNDLLFKTLNPTNPELAENIKKLDTDLFINEFSELNFQIKKEKYIRPLMETVASLSKEDLAEMVESLVSLTSLKKRMTFAEESVGGPVDVAIISKGDGFIWIKRKQYFNSEINKHFIENYNI